MLFDFDGEPVAILGREVAETAAVVDDAIARTEQPQDRPPVDVNRLLDIPRSLTRKVNLLTTATTQERDSAGHFKKRTAATASPKASPAPKAQTPAAAPKQRALEAERVKLKALEGEARRASHASRQGRRRARLVCFACTSTRRERTKNPDR